ncbi:MAG: hypothetical protein A2268_07870 [Candidatus Raymondbacteria bacterium RifOxyA12_full_50_37]|uniref:Uncharacterized protein n=1 Tax=Candidatus Raymondbacteria bacterium RIFOXYD12_FULL_49_13 TaxID=1817890 RepID=A0A1F7F7N1_UNCRA|nr:MAG: hypothetical protein A2268_07870 [Candidatus Raymondbacteria bacterium RifOxyA12_full_50_37]OGJ89623.1 MAG: hypothetical protein A2248_09590 [Candidatus Raymondbacteria bacterium RIFOXYA2_FULL_49_16]OGJ92964.1 MAG: hypothetical protein A2487_10240 [Candidatus Raymondbacteria bacterium RifOxyC12_full_50_8]OGK01838.1 MAG: hypothetical protein A2350_03845 [Candidatus Raymondbacteria bacterium RifOxyB12_full_50_8]OGK02641.1 MAG: hypothetical protein A2519_11310 [Candidatus Raymondbacteria b
MLQSCILLLFSASIAFGYVTFDGKEVPTLPDPATTVIVANVSQLYMAIRNQQAGQTILISPGIYDVTAFEPLRISVNNLSIRGSAEDPSDVVLTGKGFEYLGDEEMFQLYASATTFANLTLSECRGNCVKLQSMGNNNCLLHNVRFYNIGERMIKAPNPGNIYSRAWEIRYCHFENTKIPAVNRPDDIAGGNYIAGMDLMYCDSFQIHDNVFMNIKGATGDGRGAVFTWNNSTNMDTYRNTFIGNDKAICYWATVTEGTIKNNMIVAGANLGARIDNSIGIKLFNNTSFSADSGNGAFTFSGSSGCEIRNNIISGGISVTGGTYPDTANNIILTRNQKTVAARWFGDLSKGDLHMQSDTCGPVDKGMVLPSVTDDWDGRARDSLPDIGADEFSNNPPIDLAEFANLPKNDIFLCKATPNPFNPATVMRYSVPAAMAGLPVRVHVLSLDGKHIRTLRDGHAGAGSFSLVWDARNDAGTPVSTGVYVVTVTVGETSKTAKVTYTK